jgi:integrase
MCLLLDHGLRVSELADLKVSDLDLSQGQGQLRFYRRKVDRHQTHTLSRDAGRAARRCAEAGDLGAVGALLRAVDRRGELGKAGLSTQAIAARVGQLGAEQGIAHLSPHDCRHAWATWASAAGTPIRDLQEAGGWSSPNMPLRYAEAAAIANERVTLGDDEGDDDA